ncbi:MAG: T9SS type A sorting domain-containing protein [Lewinella sp.]|nr:T9SS type A sorting domain-containing protein [Lewinella sp.]
MVTRLLALFTFFAAAANAQITLTADNATPPRGYTDSLYLGSTAGLSAPTTGPAQVWDYSGIEDGALRVVDVLDVSENTFLPAASSTSPGSLRFQVFAAESDFYDGVDADGLFDVGRVVTDTAFPLTAITGNPNDILRFIGDTVAYEGRINTLQFPMSYPDTYGGTRIERTNLLLSVAAFGFDEVPVQARREFSESRTVAGYGQLLLPPEGQHPSTPIDVLLLQVERTAVDSFFLAGSPGPAPLLAAFGISQGMTASDQFYVFYTTNFRAPVLVIDVDGADNVVDVTYRPDAAGLVSGTRAPRRAEMTVYPNPCQADQPLVITMETPVEGGALRLFDQQGRLVASAPAMAGGGKRYEFALPNQLAAGLYWLQLNDQQGHPLSVRQLVLQ